MNKHTDQFMQLPKRERKRRLRLAHRMATERSQIHYYTDWNDNGRSKSQVIRSRAWYEYQVNRLPREFFNQYSASLMRTRYPTVVERTRTLLKDEPDNEQLRKYARSVVRGYKRRMQQ